MGITTNNVTASEMITLQYRGSSVSANLRGNTDMSLTSYNRTGDAASQSSTIAQNTLTWRNSVSADFTWTVSSIGMDFMADANYRWYNGYTTNPEPQMLVNATINKRIGAVTLSLSATDLLGQSRALSVTDSGAQHTESLSNTLGRYILLSFSYNFGRMGGRGNRGGGGFRGGNMGGGGGFRGGMGGGGFGGGRPPMM